MLLHFVLHPLIRWLLPEGTRPRWYHVLAAGALGVGLVLTPFLFLLAVSLESWLGAFDAAGVFIVLVVCASWMRKRLRTAATQPRAA